MDVFCEKYKESMAAEGAMCRHPHDYCKYRSACMIHFMSREKAAAAVEKVGSKTMVCLRFDKGNGLLPAIAQDHQTNEVLMMAYINEEAWNKSLETGKAHYWSRSRNKLWLKGESSNHVQLIKEILVDCDEDTVIYKVEQLGGAACHAGYRSCFYRQVTATGLEITDEPVFKPEEVYSK